MKQAILILAGGNLNYLTRLLDMFDGHFYVFIHLDKKCRLTEEQLKKLRSTPGVKLVEQRYEVFWGSVSIVKSTLFLCHEALKYKEVSRLHLISGTDLLLQKPAHFESFFEKTGEQEYLEYFSLPTTHWKGGGLNRLAFFYPTDFVDVRSPGGYEVLRLLTEAQSKNRVQRSLPEMPLYGGSMWWSLTRNCVKYLVHYSKEEPDLLNRMHFTYVPDEIYIQTVVMNSPYASHVTGTNLRYICWEMRNGNIPANLDISDLQAIRGSENLFARKVVSPVSDELIVAVEAFIKKPSSTELTS